MPTAIIMLIRAITDDAIIIVTTIVIAYIGAATKHAP
jgi:hypothetical protein